MMIIVTVSKTRKLFGEICRKPQSCIQNITGNCPSVGNGCNSKEEINAHEGL